MRTFICILLLIGASVQAQLADFGKQDFHKADSIAASYHGESLKNLPLLAQQLTTHLPTQIEKFRAIYSWVCNNISNDHKNYLKNRKNREKFQHDSHALAKWNAEFKKEVFQKLLKRRQTICTGFAYLVKELALLSGINCKIIDGYGRTAATQLGETVIPNHSWNAVQLNGRWYLCDPTWSSGYTRLPSYTYIFDYHDGYFLADPALFALNHHPLDPEWLLLDQQASFTQFLERPLIYKDAFKHGILPLEPSTMQITRSKNEELRFLIQAPDSLRTQDIRLVRGSKDVQIRPVVHRTHEGLFEISHRFKRRISGDIHMKLGEDYIVTYTVRVRK